MPEKKKRYPAKTEISESEYNGFPLLAFKGDFRPFKMSRKKLAVIVENIGRIREFMEKYRELPPHKVLTTDSEVA